MAEPFNFDISLIFAILNGKVSAAINRRLIRNFRENGLDITPEQWTVLLFLWEKDGVSQQELCNATYKDKPGMTRLDLAQTNVNIIKDVAKQVVTHAPNAIYIIVSNPVDILTYVFTKVSGLPERVEMVTRTWDNEQARFIFNNDDKPKAFQLDGREIRLAPFEMRVIEKND